MHWLVRTGAPQRYLPGDPGDFPPWLAVSHQARRWLDAGCFEALAADLRLRYRGKRGRVKKKVEPLPTALSTPTCPPCCSTIWRLM